MWAWKKLDPTLIRIKSGPARSKIQIIELFLGWSFNFSNWVGLRLGHWPIAIPRSKTLFLLFRLFPIKFLLLKNLVSLIYQSFTFLHCQLVSKQVRLSPWYDHIIKRAIVPKTIIKGCRHRLYRLPNRWS